LHFKFKLYAIKNLNFLWRQRVIINTRYHDDVLTSPDEGLIPTDEECTWYLVGRRDSERVNAAHSALFKTVDLTEYKVSE
jgi:hypothetical protein